MPALTFAGVISQSARVQKGQRKEIVTQGGGQKGLRFQLTLKRELKLPKDPLYKYQSF